MKSIRFQGLRLSSATRSPLYARDEKAEGERKAHDSKVIAGIRACISMNKFLNRLINDYGPRAYDNEGLNRGRNAFGLSMAIRVSLIGGLSAFLYGEEIDGGHKDVRQTV